MDVTIPFGSWLKQRRKSLDFTQEELAEQIGCSVWMIMKIESGARRPSRQIAERLAHTLQVSADQHADLVRWSRTPEQTIRQAAQQPAPYASEVPFIVGLPIQQPHLFWGREHELMRIFGIWQQLPLQNVAIIGPRRSGKTSLLYQLIHLPFAAPDALRPEQQQIWLAEPHVYQVIFVDFQDVRLQKRERLMRYLLHKMHIRAPDLCNLEVFMDLVSEQLVQPTIILFDELDAAIAAPELDELFWEGLRSLACHYVQGRLGFVLAAHEHPALIAAYHSNASPFFNIFGHTFQLGPLDEPTALALINSSPLPFAPADQHWLLKHSQCWPALLQALCFVGLTALQQHQSDWHAEALRQIQPFAHLFEQAHG